MLDHKSARMLFLVSVLVVGTASAVSLAACGRRPLPDDEREVATVNDYKIVVSDFATAVNPVVDIETAPAPAGEAKQKILEDLIIRKALIQEAQKQNFDKQGTFMKEIERYWEQSLLKLLFKKKLDQFAQTVQVSDNELQKEFSLRSVKVFAEVLLLSDISAAAKLAASQEDFEQVKDALRDKIALDEGPRWWMAGDLPAVLQESLFALESGAISQPVFYENKWAVLRLIRKEGTGLASFQKVASHLRQELLERKKQEALERWISDVRRGAVVKVNEEVLKELDLEKMRGAL